MIRIRGFLISLGQQQNHISSFSCQDRSCSTEKKHTHTHTQICRRDKIRPSHSALHANHSHVNKKKKKNLKCKLNAVTSSAVAGHVQALDMPRCECSGEQDPIIHSQQQAKNTKQERAITHPNNSSVLPFLSFPLGVAPCPPPSPPHPTHTHPTHPITYPHPSSNQTQCPNALIQSAPLSIIKSTEK